MLEDWISTLDQFHKTVNAPENQEFDHSTSEKFFTSLISLSRKFEKVLMKLNTKRKELEISKYI
jgi:ribosome-associated translation inhibitor RaiA